MTELLDRDNQTFASLLAVQRWLELKGYQISESKIYRDKDAGKISAEADGKTFKLISVLDYIERFLGGVATKKDELKNLQEKKIKMALELKEEQIARLRLNREKEQGRYLPKEEIDLQVISVLTVMDTAYRQLVDLNMSDLCHAMTGDVKKVNIGKDFMDKKLDEMMNELAGTDSFTIRIEDM